MFGDDPDIPPAIAPAPSTNRIRPIRGTRPFFDSPASADTLVMVPIASKNPDSTRVNKKIVAVSAPALANPPNKSTCPSSPKSGAATTERGSVGVVKPHSPTPNPSCSTTASTVAAAMLISTAPGTFRDISTVISSKPKQNTAIGQPSRCPSIPSRTGTVECAASGVRVTNPALTRPTSAMYKPMPTVIAVFSGPGIAFMMRSRTPLTAISTMQTPSSTTSPKACAHVIAGAIWNATMPLMPSPAASASGALPTSPMRTVITAAASAVAVVTCAALSFAPVMSAEAPRMSGLSKTM